MNYYLNTIKLFVLGTSFTGLTKLKGVFQETHKWFYQKAVSTAVAKCVSYPIATLVSPQVTFVVLGTSYVVVNVVMPENPYASPIIEGIASYTLIYKNLDFIYNAFYAVNQKLRVTVISVIPVLKIAYHQRHRLLHR